MLQKLERIVELGLLFQLKLLIIIYLHYNAD